MFGGRVKEGVREVEGEGKREVNVDCSSIVNIYV